MGAPCGPILLVSAVQRVRDSGVTFPGKNADSAGDAARSRSWGPDHCPDVALALSPASPNVGDSVNLAPSRFDADAVSPVTYSVDIGFPGHFPRQDVCLDVFTPARRPDFRPRMTATPAATARGTNCFPSTDCCHIKRLGTHARQASMLGAELLYASCPAR